MPANASILWSFDPEYIELKSFLIKRTKDAKSSMNITQLAGEFKRDSGSSQGVSCLVARIGRFRFEIPRLDSIDTERKVRMLIALGASIHANFLNQLRKDADVEIDATNRITKYRANDGSMELKGDYSQSAKRKSRQDMRQNIVQHSIPKSLESVNRSPPEVLNSSKTSENFSPIRFIKSENYAPDDSAGNLESRPGEPFLPNFLHNSPDDSSRNPEPRESRTRTLVRRYSPNAPYPGSQFLQPPHQLVPRRSVNLGAPLFRSGGAIGSPGSHPRLADPFFRSGGPIDSPGARQALMLRSGGLPRALGGLGSTGSYVRVDSPFHHRIMGPPLKAPGAPGPVTVRRILTRPRSEAIYHQIPRIKFLEAIRSLVLFLGISELEIHEKIREKIQNIDGITTIQNNEVTLALELLVARIVNHSAPNLSENEKSVSLKEFLCYLKAAILNARLEGLEDLLEKIEENIKKPESKEKNIPVEKVTKALQDTLNNVGF